MKAIRTMLVIACAWMLSFSLHAQETLSNAEIHYSMVTKASDPQTGEMVINSNMQILIDDAVSKTTMEMQIMGMTMHIENTLNRKTKKGMAAIDVMGQKMAAKITPEDYQSILDQNDNFKVTDVKPTGETLDILGYTCKKVIATTSEGEKLEIYYTEALKQLDVDGAGNVNIKGIDGLPLKYQVKNDQIDLVLEATKIEKGSVEAANFSYEIPEGYQEISYEQLTQMQGGM